MRPIVRSSEQKLTLKKLELEIEQLEADLRKYDERLFLSDQKLRSDVRDWYYRLVVTVISTAVSVVTFLWTQSYQHHTDNFKSTSTRIQEDDKGFADTLQKLSDPSVSVRMVAAAGLTSYAEKNPASPNPPTTWQRFWTVATGKTDSTELFNLINTSESRRKANAIHVAADRLNFEDDVRVLKSLGRVLSAGGATSIPYIVQTNRLLANDLVRSFGSLLAAKGIGPQNITDCDKRPSEKDHLDDFDLLVSRVQMP